MVKLLIETFIAEIQWVHGLVDNKSHISQLQINKQHWILTSGARAMHVCYGHTSLTLFQCPPTSFIFHYISHVFLSFLFDTSFVELAVCSVLFQFSVTPTSENNALIVCLCKLLIVKTYFYVIL